MQHINGNKILSLYKGQELIVVQYTDKTYDIFSYFEPKATLKSLEVTEKPTKVNKKYTKNRKENSYKGWTDEEEATLMTRRSYGLSYKQIGKQLGRTAVACNLRHQRIVKAGKVY